jgi:uncharacterized membrane protein
MTKDEYLNILQNNLENMPEEESRNILRYYREYFEDAGEENTDKVMEELGTPESLAQKVSFENADSDFFQNKYAQNDSQYYNTQSNAKSNMQDNVQDRMGQKRSGGNKVLLIVLAVIGAPIWVPLAIAVLAVLFSMSVAVVSLLFAFVVTCVVLIGSGIFAIGVGTVGMFTHVPTGLLTMGLGLLCIGIGILLLIGSVALIKLAKKGFGWIRSKLTRKGNANEKVD